MVQNEIKWGKRNNNEKKQKKHNMKESIQG